MHAFNESLKYDQRMHNADIRGSIAYAKSLTLVGILTKDEETKIVQGLTDVGKEWETGQVLIPYPSHDDLSYHSPLRSFRLSRTMRTSTPLTSAA